MRNVAAVTRATQFRLTGRAYATTERLRWSRSAPSSPPDPSFAALRTNKDGPRVLFAPAGSAGQSVAWGRALERAVPGLVAQSWVYGSGDHFAYPVTRVVPASIYGLPASWHREAFDAVVAGFTHVVIESGRPLFGPLFGFDAAAEARALSEAGVTVAMVWHGTDIRDPLRERALNPASPYWSRAHRAEVRMLHARASRNARLARESGVAQLYSTPDLAHDVPGGTWVPVTVDAAAWEALAEPDWDAPRIDALFLPSNPWIKGADAVSVAASSVAGSDAVRIVTPQRMPSTEVPHAVGSAHVVLDQFGIHLYGATAIEAMLARRVVVSQAGAPLRSAVREATGEDLPVVSTTPDRIAQTLIDVGSDRGAARELAHAGAAFAERWHSGEMAARALRDVLRFA